MNKTLKLTLAALSCAALLTACESTDPTAASPDFALAGNEFVNYTFEYPDLWEVVRNDGMIAVKEPEDNVSISCTTFEPDDPTMAVLEYWNGYLDSFRDAFGGTVEVLSVEEIKLDDVPAMLVTYSADAAGDPYRFTQCIGIRSGTAYTLTYTATPEVCDTYMSAMTHAVSTFRFMD